MFGRPWPGSIPVGDLDLISSLFTTCMLLKKKCLQLEFESLQTIEIGFVNKAG